MDCIQRRERIRVSVPAITAAGQKSRLVGELRLSVLSELGHRSLRLSEGEQEILNRRPKEQLIRRLIALKHQCESDMTGADAEYRALNERKMQAEDRLSVIEAQLLSIAQEEKRVKEDIQECFLSEDNEINVRAKKVSEIVRSWRSALDMGTNKFTIKNPLELAAKIILAKPMRAFVRFVRLHGDPNMVWLRSSSFGRFSLNSIESVMLHGLWMSLLRYQNGYKNVIEHSLVNFKILGANHGLPLDERKDDFRSFARILRDMRSSTIDGSIIAIEKIIADLEHGKHTAIRNQEKGKKSKLTAQNALAMEHWKAGQASFIEEHAIQKDCFLLLKSALSETSQNMKVLESISIRYSEHLGKLEELGRRKTAIAQKADENRKALGEFREAVAGQEKKMSVLACMLEEAIRAIAGRRREINAVRAAEPVLAQNMAEAPSDGNDKMNGAIETFLSRQKEYFGAFYDSATPEVRSGFDRSFRALAKMYASNGGVLRYKSIQERFPNKVHLENLPSHKEYSIVRLGIAKGNSYRILLELSDGKKPLIFFAGNKADSDDTVFMRNAKFIQKIRNALEAGQDDAFSILLLV